MVKYIFFRVRVRDRVGVRFISNVNYSVFSFPEGQMYDMNGCALADPRNGGPKSLLNVGKQVPTNYRQLTTDKSSTVMSTVSKQTIF